MPARPRIAIRMPALLGILALTGMLIWPGVVRAQSSVADVTVGAGPPVADAETRCLALAVYWEGRTESARGRLAIAHTVLNRVRSPDFPGTVCDVVSQQSDDGRVCQFSWWCDGESDRPVNTEAWAAAVATARQAMAGGADPSHHALFFHNARVRPAWARHRVRVARIGNHIFYR